MSKIVEDRTVAGTGIQGRSVGAGSGLALRPPKIDPAGQIKALSDEAKRLGFTAPVRSRPKKLGSRRKTIANGSSRKGSASPVVSGITRSVGERHGE